MDLSQGAACREIGLVVWFRPLSYLPFLYRKSLHYYQLPLLAPISLIPGRIGLLASHFCCYDFFPFPYFDSIPDRLPNPERPPRLLSMTDRTPTTSSPKILRRYPYRSPRLYLSIRHVILDPHRLRSHSTCRRAVPLSWTMTHRAYSLISDR